jgi:2-octaprenyl-6-methoxyphenol hydroxylase
LNVRTLLAYTERVPQSTVGAEISKGGPAMDQVDKPRILIAGTGPAGLIAALGISKAGFPVTLIGPAARRDDQRTTALMIPAVNYLDELGVLEDIRPHAAPLRVMRIVDATRRLVRAPVVTFRASEIGEAAFGLNIPNGALNEALEAAVERRSEIQRRNAVVESWSVKEISATALLQDGSSVSGALAVAADGRASRAREAAGITTSTRPYDQSALVLTFSHSRPHSDISTEFHTETGPFTQVPLPNDRSSLVWVVRPSRAEELIGYTDAKLSRLIEENMQSMLGRVAVQPGRQLYPLSAGLPKRFAQNRVALIGEAAHVFPPIGAQGLNLGIRDVQELVDIVRENELDPGFSSALSLYDGRRRPDILARAGAVNLLNLSLLSPFVPSQLLRSASLALVGSVPPLRNLFMREGMRPGSGFRSIFSDLKGTNPAVKPRS